MKISRLFHWLYAFLLTLPLVSSLWLGLIWTFNENAQVPTITEDVSREVDFNQYVYNGNFESTQYVAVFGNQFDIGVSNNVLVLTRNDVAYNTDYIFSVNVGTRFYPGYQYLFNIDVLIQSSTLVNSNMMIRPGYGSNQNISLSSNVASSISQDYASSIERDSIVYFTFSNISSMVQGDKIFISNFELFNLTQMFGIGNEPSSSQFNYWYPNDYYAYTASSREVIPNYSTRNVLDNPINYIWLPSFGGMGWSIQNVMNYLVGNMFGLVVSSGIGLTIVKLLTYWLCISLIWLVFDVIMYVPLLIHRYLDKGVLD